MSPYPTSPRRLGAPVGARRADLQNTDILAFGERRGQTVELAAISRQNVFDAIEGQFRDRLLEEATCGLEREEPQFSARQVVTRRQCAVFAALLVTAASALIVMPAVFGSALMGVLGLWFAANVAFRALLVWVGSGELRVEPLPSQPDRELPIYSILVPLYREANVLPALIGALKAIDYPADRIDAKLIVEADDAETNAAFETLSLDARFHVIRVPPSLPRTKPKACNYALPFARGEFVVIYDAEDRPETDQLRKAIAAFRALPREVACLQARLNFYNANENWLTRGMLA